MIIDKGVISMTMNNLVKMEVICQSAIKLTTTEQFSIYFDPYNIAKATHDANLVFLTHSHGDHFSVSDLNKVINAETKVVAPIEMKEALEKLGLDFMLVEPNQHYEMLNINFATIPAYNIDKPFHPKANGWVGYVVELFGVKYYISGDLDLIDEVKKVVCDVAFVPVGGHYTMDPQQAAQLINQIKPKLAIPTHYGSVVGNMQQGAEFIACLQSDIEGLCLLK